LDLEEATAAPRPWKLLRRSTISTGRSGRLTHRTACCPTTHINPHACLPRYWAPLSFNYSTTLIVISEKLQMNKKGTIMQVRKHVQDRRVILSTIWIFYIVNILYADVLNIMGMGEAPPADVAELIETFTSPEMLLGAAIFLETGMVMIVLSRVLKYGASRWTNIVVALLHTLVLVASVFVGTPTSFYLFFVFVNVPALLFIVWYAWTWAEPQNE